MPLTYDSIATFTLASETSTITFSSIPGTYTDLRLVLFGIKPSATNSAALVRVNGDATSTNYSYVTMTGFAGGSSPSTINNTSSGCLLIIGFDALVGSYPKGGTLDIFNYANTSMYKTALNVEMSDRGGGSGRTVRSAQSWKSTSAITSLQIYDGSGRNFGVGTVATLFGIKAA
jgi:hypothetical protein